MVSCPECKSQELNKAGFSWRARARIQRYRCLSCGMVFSEAEPVKVTTKKGVKYDRKVVE